MGKLTKKRAQWIWILSIFLFIIALGGALFFYIPIINHVFPVTPPEAIEGLEDPKDHPYLDIVSEVIRDPFIGFFDIIDITVLAILVLIIIPAWAYHSDQKWRDDIDDNIPSLLREVSDAQKTGLPLPRAIMSASKHNYGALTPELKKMAAKISWGIPFSKTLRSLTESTDTPLMRRTSLLILEAERSGGAIEDVFDSAHKHVSEVLGLKRERLGAMKPFTWIIFVSYIVFSLVMIILLTSFFQTLATSMVEAVSEGQEQTAALPFNVAGLQLVFFHLMVIEAVFAGLIAGKMGQGNAYLGLRYSCFLLIICYLLFKILIADVISQILSLFGLA
ncbi:MAG: type II secretion system F family protein [Candidatus Hodarchaeales archaeon]|jgi:flagellar protein FlaJ